MPKNVADRSRAFAAAIASSLCDLSGSSLSGVRNSVRSLWPPRSRLAYRLALALAIFFVGARLILFVEDQAFALTSDDGKWVVLDWLISYHGGFVRRGLAGELFLWLSDTTGLEPQIFAYLAYALFSGAMLTLMYATFTSIPQPRTALALIFAPFMLTFEALTQGAGGRKDVILLAIIAALAFVHARYGERRSAKAVEIALALFPFVVLTHEGLFLFIPYILAFAFLGTPSPTRLIRLAALTCASALVFMLTIYYRGDAQIVDALCAELGDAIPSVSNIQSICLSESAIEVLKQAPEYARAVLKNDYVDAMVPSLPTALLLVLAAFAPMAPFLGFLFRERRRTLVAISVCVCAALVLTLPLFILAVDWGRWIRIHAVATALILIASLSREQKEGAGGAFARSRFLASPAYILLVAIYAVAWSLAHVGQLVGGGLAGDALAHAIGALLR